MGKLLRRDPCLPAVKKYGEDVKVSMYEYNRPSYTDLVYPIECYFPTWVIPKDHDVTKALEEAYHNLYGEERIGAEETLAMRTARPLTDKLDLLYQRRIHHGT